MISFERIFERYKHSFLFKDSFWSVFGNGVGNFLLLMAGVVIARFLGKDLYGEYGMVKTTMFYIAGFASFGLSYSSTKFIAENLIEKPEKVNEIVISCLKISFGFSLLLCLILVLLSDEVASFVNEPNLSLPFRYLGIIIITRSIANTLNGLLGGFKRYKEIGINSIISGGGLLLFGAIFTYFWGVIGSFAALLFSQLILCILNSIALYKESKKYPKAKEDCTLELISFSLPIAIQELFFVICNWGVMLVLTKYASLGDVGIYSAASQWYAVVLFIPNLLSNVVLSYLSGENRNKQQYSNLFKKLLLINIVCAIIPFIIVAFLSDFITSFYGPDFSELSDVLRILIAGTVFACAAGVYQSDYIARNQNWLLAIIRFVRDTLILVTLYFVLINNSVNAAYKLAIINTVVYIIYFLLLHFCDKFFRKT